MTEKQTIERFQNELDKMINHFFMEHDLSYASVIGVLHIKSLELGMEANDIQDFYDSDGNDQFYID